MSRALPPGWPAAAPVEWFDEVRALVALLDHGHVTREAVRWVRSATGLETSFAGLADGGDQVVIQYTDGLVTDSLRGLPVLAGKGLGGQVIQRLEPIAVVDYEHDASISRDYLDQVRPERLRGLVAVPIMVDGHLRGVLWAGNRVPTRLGDKVIDVVVQGAKRAAVGMAAADAAKRDVEVALHDERVRLASELHDSVGALLFAIRASAHKLEGRLLADGDHHGAIRDLRQDLEAIQAQASRAAAELRASLNALNSPPAELALGVQLSSDVRDFQLRTGIKTRFHMLSGVGEIDSTRSSAIVSTVREGLLNVEKHSGAGSVVVTAQLRCGEVQVAVADDGHGMKESTQRDGMGLQIARDRLERLGGALSISMGEDRGVVLRLSLPL